ncbi:MAG: PP2C family protein-serine/threonine phosphatase [Paracoccaceae bacterium]
MSATKTAVPWVDSDSQEHGRDPFRKLIALVVDDSPSQRKMLTLLLKKWKFEVVEASDGLEALGICKTQPVDFIISDWMMPEMNGPELCKAVRKLELGNYVYFILVTSKRGKDEVAAGLDAGADDFLSKPLDMGEMHARLRAGQRLVQMQDDLVDKNKRITEAFDRLNAIYESIEKDLRAAARLQKSLIPQRQANCGPVSIGTSYQPAGHVGGDLLGYFQVTEDRIAAYSIDVSGHGVSSALLTARLSNLFSSQHLDENIAIRRLQDGSFHPRDPASIARELNERMQDDTDTDQYFTMVFADLNLSTGMLRFCQAGHPNPAVIRATGEIEFVGDGGPPVGLMPGMEYETYVIHVADGDRFMMFSDGITECETPDGEMLENEGLAKMLSRHWDISEWEVLDQILCDMAEFTGSKTFDDDVSGLMLTYPVSNI